MNNPIVWLMTQLGSWNDCLTEGIPMRLNDGRIAIGVPCEDGVIYVTQEDLDKAREFVNRSRVTDEMVERAAWKLERAHRDYWDDSQFEIWWNRDPQFVEKRTSWGFFEGTKKEKLLWETRIALEAVFGGA